MSIKGDFQTIYVGKDNSTIESFLGKRKKVIYENLSRIEYAYPGSGEGGHIDFIYPNYDVVRFYFSKNVNEKISRTITLIQDNNPHIEIIEKHPNDLPIYQKNGFILFTMLVLFPVGLFLLWKYKKYPCLVRVLYSIVIPVWMFAIYAIFFMPASYNEVMTLEKYNNCRPGMTYEEVVEIIGSEGEPFSEVDISEINTKTYVWYGNKSLGSNANITFQNNRLISKAQLGLQ